MTHTPSFSVDSHWLDDLLQRLPTARVALFGDLFLDAYWLLDSTPSERSLETGLDAFRVRTQRYSPGGGGNVAVNIAALGVKHVEVVGLTGSDLFGDELLRQFTSIGLNVDGVVRGPAGWQTLVYAKPYQGATEMNRLDFGLNNAVPAEVVKQLAKRLDIAASSCPVVVINQQMPGGWAPAMVNAISAVITRHPDTLFIVDSRDHAGSFPGTALKLNLKEAAGLLGEDVDTLSPDDALRLAGLLESRQSRPVFITRGEHGLALAVKGELYDIPGVELPGPSDPVGAGDTALAALASSFAVGAPPLEAGTLANLAAAITTRQVRTTGVATPAALRAAGPSPDYVYAPRLAAQPRLARYWPDTAIEVVTGRRPSGCVRHAIFDHDGTISVLRQGWEEIMEPMMMKAILGDRKNSIDDKTLGKIVSTVRAFIDRTTGIQTLSQMKGLVDLVREFGFVPENQVLDEHGYKAIFNKDLIAMVQKRIAQMERGELSPPDWQILHSRELLERLCAAGVTLYLASGTDEADAISEAQALGYAHLFTGGIFGAVGDLRIEAKRDVLARIVKASGARSEEIMVIGDGPVEMREARRRGAYAVGIASDEVRRYGINLRKRTRLIRAGADLIIPDFCQTDALLSYLGFS
ncbi:MAG: PfkB family carbohydrate kinase [Opitutaceae bacterium]|jgi:rfaE bifunctional protein kinase chain/domain